MFEFLDIFWIIILRHPSQVSLNNSNLHLKCKVLGCMNADRQIFLVHKVYSGSKLLGRQGVSIQFSVFTENTKTFVDFYTEPCYWSEEKYPICIKMLY